MDPLFASLLSRIGDANLSLASLVGQERRHLPVPRGATRYALPGRSDVEAYISPEDTDTGEAETAMGRRMILRSPIDYPTIKHELTHVDQARRLGPLAPAVYALLAALKPGASNPMERTALAREAGARRERRPAPAAARGMISYTRGR